MSKDSERRRPWWARFVGSDEVENMELLLESLRGELDRLSAEILEQKKLIDAGARRRELDLRERRELMAEHELALDAVRSALRSEQEANGRAQAAREAERARSEAEATALRQRALEAARQVEARARAAEQERAALKADAAAARAAARRECAAVRAESKEQLDQRDARVRALEKERLALADELANRTADRDRLLEVAARTQTRHEGDLRTALEAREREREKLAAALERAERAEREREEARAALARLGAESHAARARGAEERRASDLLCATLEREIAALSERCAAAHAALTAERAARSRAEGEAAWASTVARRFAGHGARALQLSLGRGAPIALRRSLRAANETTREPRDARRTVDAARAWLEASLRAAGMCESIVLEEVDGGAVLEVRLGGAGAPTAREEEVLWISELVASTLSGLAANVRSLPRPESAGDDLRFAFDRL